MAKKAKPEKKADKYYDDNRVIASMDVDGVPNSIFRRPRRRAARDEFGRQKEQNSQIVPGGKERRSAILGIITSYLVFGLAVFGAFALFILFAIKIWFK